MGQIAASWVISPVLGGVIAAAFLYLIKRTITYQQDMMAAARRWVPLLLALMAWSFSTYLVMKGLRQIWKVDFGTAMADRPRGGRCSPTWWHGCGLPRQRRELSNDKQGVNSCS